ncbi:MAG: hypothetical protein ABIA63_00245 [bacterium]
MKLSAIKILIFTVIICIPLEWFGFWFLIPFGCVITGYFAENVYKAMIFCSAGALLVRLAMLVLFSVFGRAYQTAEIVSSIMGFGKLSALLMYVISLLLAAVTAAAGAWLGRSIAYSRENK